jgi:aspartate 1-decarboxylase
MLREMMKSKIHMATVTETRLDYNGSLTVDRDLMDAADLLPYEKIQVVNMNSGYRMETYVIEGKRGSGVIGVNGGAARHAQVGDKVLVICYCMLEDAEARKLVPRVIFVDEKNRVVKKK